MAQPRIHSLLRRRRRRGLALVAVLAVAGALAIHHTGPLVSPMGGHHKLEIGPVAELCLGVLTVVGAVLATAAVALLAPRHRLAPLVLAPTGVVELPAPAPRPPRARAGAAFLCVMRC